MVLSQHLFSVKLLDVVSGGGGGGGGSGGCSHRSKGLSRKHARETVVSQEGGGGLCREDVQNRWKLTSLTESP